MNFVLFLLCRFFNEFGCEFLLQTRKRRLEDVEIDTNHITMSVTLGAGIGVWITAFLWALAIISCLVFLRTSGGVKYASLALFFIFLIIPVILILISVFSEKISTTTPVIYENLTRVRYGLVVVGCFFILVGLIYILVVHAMQPIYAKPLKLKTK